MGSQTEEKNPHKELQKHSSIQHADEDPNQKKLKYPKAVFFIITNEFCERFCFYGMRTILALYLTQRLNYPEDSATVIYHAFIAFAYFTPILGAMIADSWLGKFFTIFYLSIVYAIGSIILSMAAVPIIPMTEFTFVGLVLIGLGTGGIKPCVSAFGGDQFVVPQQERQLQLFFSVFYFSVNSGSFISTLVTPILREDVHCFGEESCYSLAFGVPAMLMIVSIAIFVLGKPLYIIKKPSGNVMLKVAKCIGHAISEKFSSWIKKNNKDNKDNKKTKKDHWLDYAEEKFGKELVEHIKITLRVLVLFIPLPMFWALFEQQGSRWTFQATRMNGDMGGGFVIKPDQIQVFNPALVLILIPAVETGLYPLFKKCNILQAPLRKLAFGGVLAGVAFLISAFIELGINPSNAIIPGAGEANLRISNSMNCPITIAITGDGWNGDEHNIASLNAWEKTLIKANGEKDFTMDIRVQDPQLCNFEENIGFQGIIQGSKSMSYVIYEDAGAIECTTGFEDDVEKSLQGDIKLRVLYNLQRTGQTVTFKKGSKTIEFPLEGQDGYSDAIKIEFGTYVISIDGQRLGETYYGMGGVFNYILEETTIGSYVGKSREVSPPNTLNILWQIPQYLTITTGEVMFSITGLEFAFHQAPLSMKSVVVAGWLLTNAFGNIIVIIVAEAQFFEQMIWEFVLFACLMFLFMFIFFLMSLRYKYVPIATEDAEDKPKDLSDENENKKSSHDNKAFDKDD